MPVAFRMATGLARSSACHLRQPRTAQERCVPARMDDGLQPPRIIKFFQANEVLRRDRGIPDCAVRPIARSTPVRRQGQPQKHSDIENPRITAALPWRGLAKSAFSRRANAWTSPPGQSKACALDDVACPRQRESPLQVRRAAQSSFCARPFIFCLIISSSNVAGQRWRAWPVSI
jgi:hypothetical protein